MNFQYIFEKGSGQICALVREFEYGVQIVCMLSLPPQRCSLIQILFGKGIEGYKGFMMYCCYCSHIKL